MSTLLGGLVCSSARAIAIPSGSSPWIHLDDQHFPGLVWIAELDHPNEPSLGGTPKHFMTADCAIRDGVCRRREGNEADHDAAQAPYATQHDFELPRLGRERVDRPCDRVRRGEHRQVPGAGEQLERRV
jgi:hypothetical protein